MLVDVRARMTISNNYETNRYGQLGVAFGEEPLRQPPDGGDALDVCSLDPSRLQAPQPQQSRGLGGKPVHHAQHPEAAPRTSTRARCAVRRLSGS